MSIGAEWNFYLSPKDAWEAMYDDCEKAQLSIEFEQYILQNDAIGRKFLSLFIKKASEGVRTVLICDGFGSRSFKGDPLLAEFKAKGGEFYYYNKVAWYHLLMPWRWFPRTHRKTMLIDSKTVYVGGVCMAEEMRDWRDTHIKVIGKPGLQGREAFDEIENRFRKIPPTKAKTQISQELAETFSYQPNHIYATLVKAIGSARESIYIANAFFIPNRYFITLLKQMKMQGVDIHIMLPEHSDNYHGDWVKLSYMKELLEVGIRIYHYQPTVLHCKTVAIDNDWASVGSVNMDLMSFFHNREAHVIIREPKAIAELKDQFHHDLKDCIELTHARLQTYPAWKIMIGRSLRLFKIFF